MRPILFSFSGIHVSSYYFFLSLGITIGLLFFIYYAKKFRLNIPVVIDVGIISVVSAYAGSRLFHIIFESLDYYLDHPIRILYFWQGGYVYYGGVIVSLFFTYLYLKIKQTNFLAVTDAMVIAAAVGTSIGRFACLFQGCCYGVQTNMPWGIHFPLSHASNAVINHHGATSIHPTQFYMIFSNLFIFILLAFIVKYKERKGKSRIIGELTYIYLISYALFRIIIEYFRADYRGSFFEPYFSTSQFIAVVIIVVSSIGYIRTKPIKH